MCLVLTRASVDFHFAQVEMSRDDPFYVCLVALFAAAGQRSPAVAALLPDFVLKHLRSRFLPVVCHLPVLRAP